MCTVTWQHQPDGYQLYCNRDESRHRKPALPPALEPFSGARFLAPRDADRAGTWIAVNEYGLTVCLLNGANLTTPAPKLMRGTHSRGWLVLDLVRLRSIAEMAAYLEYMPMYDYSSFTIVILAPREPALLVEWDGYRKRSKRSGARQELLSSSSLDPDGALLYRQTLFAETLDGGHSLADFHASHGAAPSAYSPWMHRNDAETVSFSTVEVTPAEVSLAYSAGAPCQAMPLRMARLTRWASA